MVRMVSNALRQIRKLMLPGKEYAGKYAKVDEEGHLGFADGSGGEGKIYTGRDPIQVDNTNDIVGISTSYGLTTENGSLKVAVGDGISFNDQDRIYIKAGDGIAIDGNNNVKADIGDGIEFENGKIQVNVGDGMMIRDHEITANLGNGLATDSNGHINVVPGSGITIDGSNRVQADIGAGLELVNNKIRARVGKGLDVDGNNYLIALIGNGIQYDNSTRISAKVNGLKGVFVGNDGIEVKAGRENSGIYFDGIGYLYVKLGDGLNFDGSGGVSAKPDTSKGLYVGSSGIGVNNGAGLTFANNQLKVDTTVIQEKLTAGTGISIDDRTNTINRTAITYWRTKTTSVEIPSATYSANSRVWKQVELPFTSTSVPIKGSPIWIKSNVPLGLYLGKVDINYDSTNNKWVLGCHVCNMGDEITGAIQVGYLIETEETI